MSSPGKDYYRILQVHPAAEQEIVEAAYRRLARKYHPDVNPSHDATRRMQEINEAYEVLRDPLQRAQYDTERAAALQRLRRGGEGQSVQPGKVSPAPPSYPRSAMPHDPMHSLARAFWFVIGVPAAIAILKESLQLGASGLLLLTFLLLLLGYVALKIMIRQRRR